MDLHIPQKAYGLIKLLRPKQWVKNTFVFCALIFSKNLFNRELFIESIYAFLLFCCISSCVYILNDIADIEKDRKHPKKKHRPLPAGLITRKQAVFFLIILFTSCVICSYVLSIPFTVIILLYFILNVLYSFKLKQIVIIDVMVIAIGFVLRAVSGAIMIDVIISPWLIICTLLISLFLGLNKRRSEFLMLDEKSIECRKTLGEYSVEMINEMLSVVSSSTIISYALYTFTASESVYMMGTIPFVLYGIFRYQYLISKKGWGDTPEVVLLKDIPLIVNILLWSGSSIIIEYIL
ncbi:MAG: decaprenyl-phosphate phosphoribosyltransferase [Clostridia bacterium]|nr:decaprenyl-phosphate phosphoribosyltransferase [Clostridia bacterium]